VFVGAELAHNILGPRQSGWFLVHAEAPDLLLGEGRPLTAIVQSLSLEGHVAAHDRLLLHDRFVSIRLLVLPL